MSVTVISAYPDVCRCHHVQSRHRVDAVERNTAIAIANTLVMATADRAKELRLWRLIGASRAKSWHTPYGSYRRRIRGLVLGTLAMACL